LTYSQRGKALAPRLRRVIRHAGSPEAFSRSIFPQGRSGGDCPSALFSPERTAVGLGVGMEAFALPN